MGEELYNSLEDSSEKTKDLPTLVKALETIDIKEVQCHNKGLREHNVVQILCSWKHCAVLVDPSPCPIRQAKRNSSTARNTLM